MTEGIHWTIRTDEQEANLFEHMRRLEKPYNAKVGPYMHPKTRRQIDYAHGLCRELADHYGVPFEAAKTDAKREYGVAVVDTSAITGERRARLISFADYTKEQMSAFISSMEVHLAERGIHYLPWGDEKYDG